MKPYIIKRILSAIPLLLIISFVCFVFINLIPSDPAEVARAYARFPSLPKKPLPRSGRSLDWTSRIWSAISPGYWTVCAVTSVSAM